MISFDIHPFDGAEPIKFGMHQTDVRSILGAPRFAGREVDSWGEMMEFNVGYDQQGEVYELGLSPGDYELKLDGKVIWHPDHHPDPNPMLLAMDDDPVDCVGFLVFTKLGIATSGFHDDDPGQFAVKLYRRGAWDNLILKSKKPELNKYI